ncbi:MAG: hypothetical protein COB50_05355 [Thiotrichales bacterium]|nr:MAG: hypothetical protein COB50_05355 [Thiotrichales bacterium]
MRLRTQLEDGESCSVCGATQHPFSKLLAQNKTLLKTQQDRYQEKKTAQQTNLKNIVVLETHIEKFAEDLRYLQGDLTKNNSMLSELNNKISDALNIEVNATSIAEQITIYANSISNLQQQYKVVQKNIKTTMQVQQNINILQNRKLEVANTLKLQSESMRQQEQTVLRLTQDRQSYEKQIKEIVQYAKLQQQNIQEVQEEHATLFAGQTGESVQDKLQKDTKSADINLQTQEALVLQQQQEHIKNKTKLEEYKKQLVVAQDSAKSTDTAWQANLTKINLPEAQVLQYIQYADERVNKEAKYIEHVEKEFARVENKLIAEKNQLNDLQSQKPLQISEDSNVAQELNSLEKAISNTSDGISKINIVLQEDAKKHKAHKELKHELHDLEKITGNWQILHQLIGSADGSKFRVFAQSISLDILLSYTNQQLKDLAPRYEINRIQGQHLELQIKDKYMGDSVRSIYSLSGGETFLLSLALALALSSMSSKKTEVESLFIDEGFATLDNENLDMVISTLDALQSSGRNIGIISHLSILSEQIATKVRVIASATGSRVEIEAG